MSIADRSGSTQATAAPAHVSEQDLATIIHRAAAIGVPAWRVTTALGMPLPVWASDGEPGPLR